MPEEYGRPRSRKDLRPWTPVLLLLICSGSAATAAIQYPSQPDWQGTPSNRYGTGCALRDLNGDNLPDLVVANGNDMARQPLVVFRNLGGTFPATPTWTSSDIDYHGHLDLADVDGDGVLDCAVAVYIGAGGFSTPGKVKLYRGNGDGTFSANPVWTCAIGFYCFSVAFGDVNMDGRPDLACTAGESYNYIRERYRVFRNVGGVLETTPTGSRPTTTPPSTSPGAMSTGTAFSTWRSRVQATASPSTATRSTSGPAPRCKTRPRGRTWTGATTPTLSAWAI